MTKQFSYIYIFLWIAIFIGCILISPSSDYMLGGDFFHTAWSLKNNIDNLLLGQSFAKMNILYPFIGEAPLHELAPLNTLLFIPFYLSKQYIHGLYFIYVFHTIATVIATYFLAKNLGIKSNAYAALASFATVLPTFRITHASHLQILATELIFVGIISIFYWIKLGGKFRALFVYGVFAIIFCGPSYILAGLIIFIFIYSLIYSASKFFSPRRLIYFYLVILLAIATNYKILIGYLKLAAQGFTRSEVDAAGAATDLTQLVMPIKGSIYNSLLAKFPYSGPDISNFFPGYILFSIVVIAFVSMLYRRILRGNNINQINIISLYITAFIFIGISLGPVIKFNGIDLFQNPIYAFFYHILPILRSTRFTPFYGFVGISILILLSFIILEERLVRRNIWFYTIGFCAFFFSILENQNYAGLKWQKENIASTYEEKALIGYKKLNYVLPKETKAIISLPIWGYNEYNYMYYSLFHSFPTYNGLDGFYPHSQKDIKVINDFPSKESLEIIKKNGVNGIIIHRKYYRNDCIDYSLFTSLSLRYFDETVCVYYFPESQGINK